MLGREAPLHLSCQKCVVWSAVVGFFVTPRISLPLSLFRWSPCCSVSACQFFSDCPTAHFSIARLCSHGGTHALCRGTSFLLPTTHPSSSICLCFVQDQFLALLAICYSYLVARSIELTVCWESIPHGLYHTSLSHIPS